MLQDRRYFLKKMSWLTVAGAGLATSGQQPVIADDKSSNGSDDDKEGESSTRNSPSHDSAHDSHQRKLPDSTMGVLVDLSLCIGCRLCEYACKTANHIEAGDIESYDDQSVFVDKRRPAPDAFTVVNQWDQPNRDEGPVYVKLNCMHCNHPACVSACIVGALRKKDNGAVTYDAWKCIGCRYCMVACPFQIPTYEYDDVFTPEVRKCTFCFERTSRGNEVPACVKECPNEVLTFGKRTELIKLAHDRIAECPERYIDHVYGEYEVGGTSWLYLSPVNFEDVGFLKLGYEAPPALTEKIQHSVFKYGIPPAVLYGLLGVAMLLTKPRRRRLTEVTVSANSPNNQASTDYNYNNEVERDYSFSPEYAQEQKDTDYYYNDDDDNNNDDDNGTEISETGLEYLQHPYDNPQEHPHSLPHEHEHHHPPAPVNRRLFTPGVMVLLMFITIGLGFGFYRFAFGLEASTNLDQQWPWGLWIAIDIACGVALAAGGFTSAALAHVFHREHYHAIARPALLTAMLGYTFVALGLQADLGRYYNVWHPLILWQGNSVLFEVGTCVVCYLTVLYLEFTPIACERMMQKNQRFPRLSRLAGFIHSKLEKVMFLLVIAGCVLSCLHQSSLGTLMVISPTKLHPLWWTPYSPLFFLLSAIAVGFPMVIWESLFASWSLKLKPEMEILGPLGRYVPLLLGIYLIVKIWDMIHRGTYVYLDDGTLQSTSFIVEIAIGVIVPIIMMLFKRVRQSPRLLFTAAFLVILGLMLNRINVFLIGYSPPFAERTYVPSIGEFAVTIGLISGLMLIYRIIVTYLPVISHNRSKVLT